MPFAVVDPGTGSVTAFNLPLSPLTGWQHGRIDATTIAHACSFARRTAYSFNWLDPNKLKENNSTTFAVAHDILVLANTSQEVTEEDRSSTAFHPHAMVSPDVLYFGTSTVGHIGNSSVTLLTKVYIQQQQEESDGKWFTKGASLLNTESARKEPQLVLQRLLGKEGSSKGYRRPLELGLAMFTIVNISLSTRKSTPIASGVRQQFEAAFCKPLAEEWMSEANAAQSVPRGISNTAARSVWGEKVAVNSALLLAAAKAFATHTFSAKSSSLYSPQQEQQGEAGSITLSFFSQRFPLRATDFDFNRHMNMNMYPTFAVDTLKLAMRSYLDKVAAYEEQQSEKSGGDNVTVVPSPEANTSGPQPSSPLAPTTEEQRNWFAALPTLSPCHTEMPKDSSSNSSNNKNNETPTTTEKKSLTVMHLGELLVRRGYQSIVSVRPYEPADSVVAEEKGKQQLNFTVFRPRSVEECVRRSRMEYQLEIADLFSQAEVSAMVVHTPESTSTGMLKVQYVIRCLPSHQEATPYVAAIGEMLLGQ